MLTSATYKVIQKNQKNTATFTTYYTQTFGDDVLQLTF